MKNVYNSNNWAHVINILHTKVNKMIAVFRHNLHIWWNITVNESLCDWSKIISPPTSTERKNSRVECFASIHFWKSSWINHEHKMWLPTFHRIIVFIFLMSIFCKLSVCDTIPCQSRMCRITGSLCNPCPSGYYCVGFVCQSIQSSSIYWLNWLTSLMCISRNSCNK